MRPDERRNGRILLQENGFCAGSGVSFRNNSVDTAWGRGCCGLLQHGDLPKPAAKKIAGRRLWMIRLSSLNKFNHLIDLPY